MNGPFAQSTFKTVTPCTLPTGRKARDITLNSAVLSWNAVIGEFKYIVEYKDASYANWTGKTSTPDTFLNLRGLKSRTLYDWRIKVKCFFDSTNYALATFKTDTCGVPSRLSVSKVTLNSATFGWSSVNGSTFYKIDLKPITSPTWTKTTNTADTFLNLGQLIPHTVYVWRIKASCSDGNPQSSFLADTLPLSVKGINKLKYGIEVFPNPVGNTLNIRTLSNKTILNMYDLQGRKVLSQSMEEKETAMDLGHLQPGIYILEAFDTNGFKQTIRVVHY